MHVLTIVTVSLITLGCSLRYLTLSRGPKGDSSLSKRPVLLHDQVQGYHADVHCNPKHFKLANYHIYNFISSQEWKCRNQPN